ncbi:Phage integrase [Caballeronia peredens]|nr:Phage integrase [Caballeronia peredens]
MKSNEEKAADTSTIQPNRFKFTETSVAQVPLSTDGKQRMYYDTESKLALRVGAKKKIFVINKRLPGRGDPVRVTLGECGDIPVSKARQLATVTIADVVQGVNPHEVRKQEKLAGRIEEANKTETVGWLLEQYKNDRLIKKNGGKPASLKSFEDSLKFFARREVTVLKFDEKSRNWTIDGTFILEDWLSRPYRSITRKEVEERFETLSRTMKQRGKKPEPIVRQNQLAFKILHAAYNLRIKRLELEEKKIVINPVRIISDYELWRPTNVVDTYLNFVQEEGPIWWNAVTKYESRNLVAAYYLKFSLLQTGRSIDIHKLTWNDIDFKQRIIKYIGTKNSKSYILHISDYALEILQKLKKLSRNEYVFYYPESAQGCIPKDARHHFANVQKLGGALISHHDLRRTWGTIAITDSLQIQKLTVDYCMKHTFKGVDENYFKYNEESVRGSMQKVEDYILQKVEKYNASQSVGLEDAA